MLNCGLLWPRKQVCALDRQMDTALSLPAFLPQRLDQLCKGREQVTRPHSGKGGFLSFSGNKFYYPNA